MGRSPPRPISRSSPAQALGVDGCTNAWVVAALFLDSSHEGRCKGGARREHHAPARASITITRTLAQALELGGPRAIIAIDMPIGMLSTFAQGGRACDTQARALLNANGARRGCTIFSPPTRAALATSTYRDACAANARGAPPGSRAGLSKQAFNLFPKLRELDALMTHFPQSRLRETHPELVFSHIARRVVTEPKSSSEGHRRRGQLLAQAGIANLPALLSSAKDQCARLNSLRAPGTPPINLSPDDVLDALACALTAMRIAQGTAVALPREQNAGPPQDAKGLAMQIWF